MLGGAMPQRKALSMSKPVITSLLEQDFYKFTMGQMVLHQLPGVNVKVEFRLRTRGVDLVPYIGRINEELDHLCELRFSDEEIAYLRGIRFLASDFCDYLRRLWLYRDQIHVEPDPTKNGGVAIWAEGPWRDVIWFEIPVLAIVQELWMRDHPADPAEGHRRLDAKIAAFNDHADWGFKVADFGLRRRYSGEWHREVVRAFSEKGGRFFSGTSDVYLAKEFGVSPIGTFAHELFMGVMGTDVRVSEVQRRTLDMWAHEYRGELGIALSDIFGFRAFLRDFDLYFAKLFDGCRHDSGDPFTWGEMLIDHYRRLRIDPRTKTACWSDSLDTERALAIAERFRGRLKVTFGIGTHLTNDLGVEPLSIVMKLTEANGHPVVKLSDSPGKSMCDDASFVEYVKQQYDWRSIDG